MSTSLTLSRKFNLDKTIITNYLINKITCMRLHVDGQAFTKKEMAVELID